MAVRAHRSAAEPETIAFTLERFELTAAERIEISGRWFGVRGRRFVRPTLTLSTDDGERRALADLEHKPWAPQDGEPWVAAFPWDGDLPGAGEAELAVAPDIAVPIRTPSSRKRARRRAQRGALESSARPAPLPPSSGRSSEREDADAGPDAVAQALQEAIAQRDSLVRDVARLRRERMAADALHHAQLERQRDATEATVAQRLAELRVEYERERAGASRMGETIRERDAAFVQRDAAARRAAHAEDELDATRRDLETLRRDHNELVAQRDAARRETSAPVRDWERRPTGILARLATTNRAAQQPANAGRWPPSN